MNVFTTKIFESTRSEHRDAMINMIYSVGEAMNLTRKGQNCTSAEQRQIIAILRVESKLSRFSSTVILSFQEHIVRINLFIIVPVENSVILLQEVE